MFCHYLLDIASLVLRIQYSSTLEISKLVDLTPIENFRQLKELWIFGYPTQRLTLTYSNRSDETSLPIEHLHLHMKLALYSETEFDPSQIFLQKLTRLKTIDIKYPLDPRFTINRFLQLMGNPTPLDIISLRYLQSQQRNMELVRTLNLTSTFPAHYAKSVRYLDLSHNSYEAVAGGFIQMFPQLKFLDLSHNNLGININSLVSIYIALAFHPNLQVLSLERQFQIDNSDIHGDFNSRSKRNLPRPIDTHTNMQRCLRKIPINEILTKHESFCSFMNCVLEVISESIPCQYVSQPQIDANCFRSAVLPVAPNLKQIRIAHLTDFSFPSTFLSTKTKYCVGNNVFKSLDISSNDAIVASFVADTVLNIDGFSSVEEIKLTDIHLVNDRQLDARIFQTITSMRRLYLSSNSLFIPSDFRLCHMFPNITVLDISNCKLQQLPQHFLDGCKHLQLLNVSANQMISIPKNLRKALDNIQRFQDISIDFSQNPFHCHCRKGYNDVISMIQWMRQTSVKLLNPQTYQCTGHEQVELLLEKDMDAYKDLCSVTEEIVGAIVSTLVACVVVASIVTVGRVAYKYRYLIKTWIYRWKLRNDVQDESEYDIYLSFDQTDICSVLELVDKLEHIYGFRCCIPDRDFDGHGVHVELISQYMTKCRMSIIVLSRKALQNPTHFMERNLARQMELHSYQMKKVLYVFLEDLHDVTESDVRSVISGNLGLRYSNDSVKKHELFFDKLCCKIYKALQ